MKSFVTVFMIMVAVFLVFGLLAKRFADILVTAITRALS